jgi:hypothetical protein
MTARQDELRAYFGASPLRGVLLEGLIPAALAVTLRQRLAPLVRPYFLADRGRYHVDDTHHEPELFAGLAALAADIAGARVAPAAARWTRLVRGDFAMLKDDHRRWSQLGRHLEVVLDFSAATSSEAQVVWSGQGHVLWMPQVPLAGALVDRRHAVQRYDRYLTHRVGAAEVYRLSLALEVLENP